MSKLNQESMRQTFLNDICNHLDTINLSSEEPAENWTDFNNAIHSSVTTSLEHPSRTHHDWFKENDEEIMRHLEEKRQLHKAHHDDTSSVPKKTANSNICKIV